MKKFNVKVNGNTYEVEVEEVGGAVQTAAPAPVAAPAPAAAPVAAPAASGSAGSIRVEAPMPGTVVKYAVSAGSAVKKGDTILILEAMKMENEIAAPEDGTVASINSAPGASVNTGDLLATLN